MLICDFLFWWSGQQGRLTFCFVWCQQNTPFHADSLKSRMCLCRNAAIVCWAHLLLSISEKINQKTALVPKISTQFEENVFFRCACAEPRNPSNETLEFWEDRNVTPSQVNWTALEVAVSIAWLLKKKVNAASVALNKHKPLETDTDARTIIIKFFDSGSTESLILIFREAARVQPWIRDAWAGFHRI